MDKSRALQRIVLAIAFIVLILSSGSACRQQGDKGILSLKKFTDLAGAGVRIGIVDPELGPAGRYAQQVLAKQRLDDPALVTAIEKNIVTYESHVRALLNKILRHEIDAGFVYRSDILQVKDKVSVIEIPPSFSVSPEYALARMQGARTPAAALAFIRWLQAPEQSPVWQEYGFRPLSLKSHLVYPDLAPATVDDNYVNSVKEPLTVFAAAVFYSILPQLAQAYQRESGIIVECEFAGSGKLYQKIIQGAVGECGADIFLSASPVYVTELEQRGLADCGRIFMGNDLVIAVFDDSTSRQ